MRSVYGYYRYIFCCCKTNVVVKNADGLRMPLVRKIIAFGNSSKGIILPKSWLDILEEKYGNIESVSMEVDGKLIISPIIIQDQKHTILNSNQ